MATNINITVGDDDLVARARQEMAAHRSGSGIAQSRAKAGVKGKAERARRLASQGKDAESRIIPTAPFQPPRRDEELTANLSKDIKFDYFYLNIEAFLAAPAIPSRFGANRGFTGQSYRLTIETRNGAVLTDPAFEQAYLDYPTNAAGWNLAQELYTGGFNIYEVRKHQHLHVLPVSERSAILAVIFKKSVGESYKNNIASSPDPSTTLLSYTQDYVKCFLVTPNTVREIPVPSLIADASLYFRSGFETVFSEASETKGPMYVIRPVAPTSSQAYLSPRLKFLPLLSFGAVSTPQIVTIGTYPSSTVPIQRSLTPSQNFNDWGVADPFWTPGVYGYWSNPSAYATAAFAQQGSFEDREWNAQFVASPLQSNRLYGLDYVANSGTASGIDLGFPDLNQQWSSYQYPAQYWDNREDSEFWGYPPKKRLRKNAYSPPVNRGGTVLTAKGANVVWSTLGQTALCKRSLLSMGFAAEDLRP